MTSMTSRERIVASLMRQPCDHVPAYPICSGVSRLSTGVTYPEWSTNADKCAEALIKTTEECGLDTFCTLIDLSLEADAWGLDVVYPANEAAHPNYNNPVLKDIEDYATVKKVDYRTSERMLMHIEVCRQLVEKKGKDVPVIAFVFGPLGILSMLRNQQEMYMDLYDDPDAVKAAAKEINETLKEYITALMDTGVDAIMIDTLFASGSIMAKDMWMEMEGVLVRELADMIHARGVLMMIHNCGQKIYFDVQIETMRPHAISFLYPPDDCASLEECKAKYGDKTTLIGCVPPAMVVTATDEEFDAECRRQIDIFKENKGFVLATGCEYPANASFDRAKRMVEIAREYGKYND